MGWGRIFLLMAVSGVCGAQKYVPPSPPLTVDPCAATVNPLLPKDMAAKVPVCPPPTVTPPTAGTGKSSGTKAEDQFPFPGETAPAKPAPATPSGGKPPVASQFPYPGSAPIPPAAAKTADQFPYPGETSKSPDAVPEGNIPRYVPDSPSAGEDGNSNASSSSSSSSSSAAGDTAPANKADDADGGNEGASRRASGRRALPKVSAVTPEDRVSEDLDVAKFYSDRGNFQAAYLRAKDATKLMPEDAESHFALAQASQKLKRKDEAAAEYAAYLKLDPSGTKTAAARQALAQLR